MNLIEDLLERYESGNLKQPKFKLENLDNKPIILFGAGGLGKDICRILKNQGKNVLCFLDTVHCTEADMKKKIVIQEYQMSIYHPENSELKEFLESSYIILSALFSLDVQEKIKEQLSLIGFKNVYALTEVNFKSINSESLYELLHISNDYSRLLKNEKLRIIDAFNLLKTDQDKDLYIEHIQAHITKNFSEKKEPFDVSLQYLAHDIPEVKDYRNFIDCGAYDGDTIKSFSEKGVSLENVVFFEPQNDLHEKIVKYVEQNNEKFNSALIFPCGVSFRTQKLRFSKSETVPSSSMIDEYGSEVIQCVAIDDVLHGFNPTFIKMDIEGAELDALKGARNTIMNNRPQLAICVYHSLSHIWEIPLLINSYYEGYKFYLRCYNQMGLETVLYAFPE